MRLRPLSARRTTVPRTTESTARTPTHFGPAFPSDDEGGRRIRSVRANASSKSHAELDEADTLDTGDPAELAGLYRALRSDHPQLTILGGCCGTDAMHIDA